MKDHNPYFSSVNYIDVIKNNNNLIRYCERDCQCYKDKTLLEESIRF